MFFIGTAQFPLPFRCVLSFGRAAVAVPRGQYAVRSGVRFAAFGGAVRRTFRSGFRTGQGQRVPRHAATSLRVRGEGPCRRGGRYSGSGKRVGVTVRGRTGERSPGRPVSSYRCPVVAEAVFLCGSWRKRFAGDGVSGESIAGGTRHTVLSADGFVAAGAPFRHAGPENAVRRGAVSGGPVRGSGCPGPAGEAAGSVLRLLCVGPGGLRLEKEPAGPERFPYRGRRTTRRRAGASFFCVRAAGMRIVSQKALYLHRTGTDLPNRK